MNLELTMEEAKLLKEALTCMISELGMEIADTDLKDFRDRLKKRKALLMGMMDRISKIAA